MTAISAALLLAQTGPATPQETPLFLVCSGVTEYTFWAYERIQDAEGHTDFDDRVRLLRIASGVFVQAHVEETGCDTTHDAIRAVIQTEANLASEYFGSRRTEGAGSMEVLGEFDEIIDRCIGLIGDDRFIGFMDEFAANGPPCGWGQ